MEPCSRILGTQIQRPQVGFELLTSYMQSSYIPNLQHQVKLKENFTLIHEIWLLLINYNFL